MVYTVDRFDGDGRFNCEHVILFMLCVCVDLSKKTISGFPVSPSSVKTQVR